MALPPGTPSGSSNGHEQHRQSAWSDSTYESVCTDFPSRSTRALRESSTGQHFVSHSTSATHVLRPLPERRDSLAPAGAAPVFHHAATSPPAFYTHPHRPSGVAARAHTLPSRAPARSRSPGSAPWFAGTTSPAPHARNVARDEGEGEGPVERLESSRHHAAILAGRRPISWFGRQASNGSLPEGTLLGFGSLEVRPRSPGLVPRRPALTAS